MKWLIFFMSPIDTKKRMLYYIGKNLGNYILNLGFLLVNGKYL